MQALDVGQPLGEGGVLLCHIRQIVAQLKGARAWQTESRKTGNHLTNKDMGSHNMTSNGKYYEYHRVGR